MTKTEDRNTIKFSDYITACEQDIECVAISIANLKADDTDTPEMVRLLSLTADVITNTMRENISTLRGLLEAPIFDAHAIACSITRHSAGLEFVKELANTAINNAREIPIAGRRMIVILRIAYLRDVASRLLDYNTACTVVTFLAGKRAGDEDEQA